MQTSRRGFLTGSLVGTAASAVAVSRGGAAPAAARAPSCLDYAHAFICGTAAFNSVRFWVESRTTLIGAEDKPLAEFYQCASCKSENTFGKKNLFYEDNYDFLPILGDGDWLVFRRPARLSAGYRRVAKAESIWGTPVLHLRRAKQVAELDTWEKIRDATAAGTPIVSQTELTSDATDLKAIIECPVKTMNISHESRQYQVDTGPVALPDLSRHYARMIECLRLAFVAFNAPHFADFVVEQPTPVIEGGVEKCKIHHYSNPVSYPARNRLLALTAA
jgi:hypothetical protein